MAQAKRSKISAGLYLIRHQPSGFLYVGQANNIKKRWSAHKKQLASGSHHNRSLQELWNESAETDFVFDIVEQAPIGLSSLQLQRWLVKEERKIYLELKDRGVALNEVEPEIVATNDAVKEYQKEEIIEKKEHDKQISAKRKLIKERIGVLERKIDPKRIRLYELRSEYRAKHELLKNSTGWRRLFHGRAVGYNPENERKLLEDLVVEITRLTPQVKNVKNEIYNLEEEYRHLYKKFSKVAEKAWARTLRYGLGRHPTKTQISE